MNIYDTGVPFNTEIIHKLGRIKPPLILMMVAVELVFTTRYPSVKI